MGQSDHVALRHEAELLDEEIRKTLDAIELAQEKLSRLLKRRGEMTMSSSTTPSTEQRNVH